MVKQVSLCFVVAIAATIAGFYLCQSEGFRVHYCTMLFVVTFVAMICTCAFWSNIKETLEGFPKETKKSIIEDSIAFTIVAWILPISMLAVGLMK